MYHRRPPKYRCIRYSLVTGQAVWVYQGQSKGAMRKKYYRTVEKERKRRRQWPRQMKRRQANINNLLQECIAETPILGELTQEQREAIKFLRQQADTTPEFSSQLLEHDKERRHQYKLQLRRWHYWRDAEFRQHEKERRRKGYQKPGEGAPAQVTAEISHNNDYDK